MTALYTFRGRCLRVIDGDTLDVVLDVGFHGTRTERLRLLGVNCPELHKGDNRAAGAAARDFTQSTITEWQTAGVEWPLLVATEKSDVFGRYLARVSPGADPAVELSGLLLAAGHAVPFMV